MNELIAIIAGAIIYFKSPLSLSDPDGIPPDWIPDNPPPPDAPINDEDDVVIIVPDDSGEGGEE